MPEVGGRIRLSRFQQSTAIRSPMCLRLALQECCHIPNLPNIFSVKFEEVYGQHGECASVEGHGSDLRWMTTILANGMRSELHTHPLHQGLFLESFKIKLRCNSLQTSMQSA